ncbi:unnamed protein product, partial [Polarella glacialis]
VSLYPEVEEDPEEDFLNLRGSSNRRNPFEAPARHTIASRAPPVFRTRGPPTPLAETANPMSFDEEPSSSPIRSGPGPEIFDIGGDEVDGVDASPYTYQAERVNGAVNGTRTPPPGPAE